ncbi:MAG: hypothetical protein HLUCCA11_10660 [Phormidesmis priestleyi Ana]|uniref:Uncharacterized protein n=1 Tax=Phormidesmis priestleyi Ana TaxID=1666911 RepID=A0A0P7ZKR6_9CYAN|nr:MAG: hypothetical protein HLUCCA11_10660 [Phormidesmis priestleyi Ana]
MAYTTAQLLDIIDAEMKAAVKGQRLLLNGDRRLDNPVITKAIGPQKLSQIYAFQDFREQIHQYQIAEGVSGIVWRECTFQGRSVRFPEIHPQLTATAEDKLRLGAAKGAVIAFWRSSIANLKLWRASNPPEPIDAQRVETLIENAEWADVEATRSELYLLLCWGNPKESYYAWAYPESGCDRIIATLDRPSGIKV